MSQINHNSSFWKNNIAWLCIGLFYFFYLSTAWSNRLVAGDDLHFLNALNEKGLFDSILEFQYNKRYASFFIFNLTFFLTPNLETTSISLFVYHLIVLIGLVTGTYLLLKVITQRFIDALISKRELFILSNFIAIGIFFCVPQFTETWFWMIGSTVYGIPIIATLFGFYFLLSTKNTFFSYAGLFLSFVLLGGCLETMDLSVIVIIISIFTMPFILGNPRFRIITKSKVIIALIGCSVFLAINVLEGGTNARINFENNAITKLTVTWSDFFESFIQSKNIFPLFTLIIVFLFSTKVKKPINKSFLKKIILLNLFLFTVISTITIVPMFLVFNCIGYPRAWLPIHLFIFVSLIYWSYVLGRFTELSGISLKLSMALFGLAGLLFVYTYRQIPRGIRYSNAYDQMINSIILEKENKRQTVLELSSLPDPGFLVQFDISNEPDYWNNETVKKVMHLQFDIKKEE